MRRQLRRGLDAATKALGPWLIRSRMLRVFNQSVVAAAGWPRKSTVLRGVPIVWQARTRMDEYRTGSKALEAKEPETLDWIDAHVKGGDVLVDIGANVGVYSIYAALKTKRQCRVYAFEPDVRNLDTLNSNILLNGLGGVVTAFGIAVADDERLTTLESAFDESGQSGNALRGAVAATALPTARVQGAVALSLDKLVYELDLPCPTHLKIDTDGAELLILAGAGRLLRDPRLKTILCEVGADTRAEVFEISRALGFRNVFGDGAHDGANALLVRN